MPPRTPVVTFALSASAVLATTPACAPRTLAPLPPQHPAPSSAPPAPYDIAYHLAIREPTAHLYAIQLDIGGLTSHEDAIELQLPVWSPGRYARMDFAQNVQEFHATDDGGRPLPWEKENGSLWRVRPRGAPTVRVTYRVFADDLSGTFSVLDTAHANWNGAPLFMYVAGHKSDPVRLTVDPPTGWHAINGWSEAPDQTAFRFPNYDLLIDTPTEVSPAVAIDTFRADGILYRVMVHHNRGADPAQRARFARDIEKLVRYENRVVAPPPISTYTFLFHIGYKGGDGMEHLNATQIIEADPWTDTAAVLPGVGAAAHEYFHTWNVKRIRPIALGPFDYTREQYQPSLWVAEGWTQYYGDIAPLRAGIISRNDYLATAAGVIRYNLQTPGRHELSARMASFHAPFWDGAVHAMQTNRRNTWISYYYKGEALAMLLDLQIRARTGNTKSLDDVLRVLKARTWDAPSASYYLQGRGYTEEDVERTASAVALTDLHPWFERYVGGTEDPPFAETLALAGMRLVTTGDGASLSYRIEDAPDATETQHAVRDGWLTGATSGSSPPAGRESRSPLPAPPEAAATRRSGLRTRH